MINEELTNMEADDLYRRYEMPLGLTSGVPIKTAVELFGHEAVEFVRGLRGGNAYVRPAGIHRLLYRQRLDDRQDPYERLESGLQER